ALAHEKFLDPRYDGFKRRTRSRSSSTCARKQSGIRHRAGKFAGGWWCQYRQRDFRRRGLRTAIRHFAAREIFSGATMATKISKAAADSNWLAQSPIANRKSQIAPWLSSLPTAPLKRKQSLGNLQRILLPVPCWLSQANWAVGRRCSPKVSSPDWETPPLSRVQHLRLCTNIQAGACPFITSISSAWKIENQSRDLTLMIIFLATAFR